MNIKALTVALCATVCCMSANAQQYKFYGFIRNYFVFDSRESVAGTGDLYYWMPKDRTSGTSEDMNAVPSFRFNAITSRLGVDISGYEYKGMKIGAKVEADFYSGVSGVTGTAQLRLRQAYATVVNGDRSWKIGQAWHPMAADLPDIFSLESGVPFGPFSRTPQVTLEYSLGSGMSLTGAAIWQMQYTSVGPNAASANFQKYSCTPEIYAGINCKLANGNLVRFGADLVSIKPRTFGTDENSQIIRVDDRLTTFNLFQYGQFKTGGLTVKEKFTYANDGSHMNVLGGYGVSKENDDHSWEYSATRMLSGWTTLQYKGQSPWVPSILLGAYRNFGTPDKIVGGSWCKNNSNTVGFMYRIQPEVLYNLGKLQLGFEYMLTGVRYGNTGSYMAPDQNFHWIRNHRLQAMVKYSF